MCGLSPIQTGTPSYNYFIQPWLNINYFVQKFAICSKGGIRLFTIYNLTVQETNFISLWLVSLYLCYVIFI